MAYILKNSQGDVVAASAFERMDEGWEFVEDNHNKYVEFLESSLLKNAPFRESDLQMARVLEDLISILIEKNVIRFTDLPQAAQKRLNDRQNMRISNQITNLFDKNDD